ncbi:kinase-like protein, partial [Rickenella mellea]
DQTNRVQQTEQRPRCYGGFAKVFYGELRLDSGVVNVAIKRVNPPLPDDEKTAKIIIKELKIWSRLNHQNVLQLRGYTLDCYGDFPALISEWMTNGTVRNYLEKNPEVDFFDMVKGIADGLEYLHKEEVVHADLKSENVLISISGTPLLTDFGISRTLIVTHTVTTLGQFLGSVYWMAYELLAPQEWSPQGNVDTNFVNTLKQTKPAVPSKETDVWAFGMVVYELLAKTHPFRDHTAVQAIVAIILGRLPFPPPDIQSRRGIDKSLWDLCTRCWNRGPSARPVMRDVVMEINGRNFVS